MERFGERDTEFETSIGPVERLYTPEDIADVDYDKDVGYPGEYPFTRGVQATMYRGRLWSMRQYAGFGGAAESNERFKFLLSQGQTGLSVDVEAVITAEVLGMVRDHEKIQRPPQLYVHAVVRNHRLALGKAERIGGR